jgi:hypothetical protein
VADRSEQHLSPEQAVERLETLHSAAMAALRAALGRFVRDGTPPDPRERVRFRYPELRLVWQPTGPMPFTRRAWAKFQTPGVYTTTVTQPGAFRRYLLEQLRPLIAEYGAAIAVASSTQEIPYPYVLEHEDELFQGAVTPGALARHFPAPMLSAVGDEVADGLWVVADGNPLPLAMFDAVRVDYSLRRLVHYPGRTGAPSGLDPAGQPSALSRPVRALGGGRAGGLIHSRCSRAWMQRRISQRRATPLLPRDERTTHGVQAKQGTSDRTRRPGC